MVKVGRATVEVVQGDITKQDTEAIVNAANNYLWMGGGVAGAIKREGGKEIEDEAVSKGPIEVGEAVVTGAGKLKAKYVIHAAGMGQDLKTDAEKVRKATESSLLRAEEMGISSVAFPAIGTGVGGLSPQESAKAMIDAVIEHLLETKCIEKVLFVLFDEHTYNVFHDELIGRFSRSSG